MVIISAPFHKFLEWSLWRDRMFYMYMHLAFPIPANYYDFGIISTIFRY